MSKYIVEKVDDPNLIEFGELVLRNTRGIIAGGVFRDLIEFSDNGLVAFKTMKDIKAERSKDVDIFFRNEREYEHFKNEAESWIGSTVHYNGSNSVGVNMLLDTTMTKSRLVYLDLVHKYFGTPEQILDGFDFTISQCALYREDDSFYLMYGKDFKNHLHNKILEYADGPEKSGHIIERMVRYVGYNFVPSEETVRNCLVAFCQSYENLRNVNVDEFLLNPDFQTHQQERAKQAEAIKAKGYENKLARWGQQHSMKAREQQLQNKWLSFIYFLRNYWHSIVKFDEFFAASFTSKYAASFNTAILLEQMSKGFSYKDIEEKCSELAGNLGVALITDEEDEYRWVYSSYSLMNLLEFFHREKEALGLEKIQSCLINMFSYRFVPQSKKNYILCHDCNSMIHDRTCDCEANTRLSMLEADVLLKVLTHKKSDEEWMNECLNFFSQIYENQIEEIPTLFEWHHALENEMFEPSSSPSLMFSLMIDSSMEVDHFTSID